MDIQTSLATLNDSGEETAQLEAIDRLSAHAGKRIVFDILCAVALKTSHATVRNSIINLLKPHAEDACRRFSRAAAHATLPDEHRWALVNLSLLGCRSSEALSAVCDGLGHPNFEIQKAAFMSTGLFDDPAFLREVVCFIERNRFFFVKDGLWMTAYKIDEFLKRKRPRIFRKKRSAGRRMVSREMG